MSNKDFKLKNGLIVPSLSTAGVVKTDSSGVITSSATLSLTEGGTGQTTASNALNALLPLQTGNANYFLQTNEITSQWTKVYNQTIKNNGTTVTPRSIVNIIGGTFADSSGTDTTTIDLSGYISNTGGSTITASSASVKPLIIKGATSQTANLTEWQNSAGDIVAALAINTTGGEQNSILKLHGAYGGIISNGEWSISRYGGDFEMLAPTNYLVRTVYAGSFIIRGAASQTADLQQWQDSAGTVLASVGAYGEILIKPSSASVTPLIIQASPAYPAALQQWQNSSGTTLAQFRYNGALDLYDITPLNSNSGTYISFTSGALYVLSRATTTSTLIVKAAASQTANLQEWQNSAGTVIGEVVPSGQYVNRAQIYADNTQSGSPALVVKTNYGNVTPFVVQGASDAQTADLQTWITNSGTVLAKVDGNGSISAVDLTLSGNLTVNGTTTNLNSTNLVIEDKNIIIADVATPTDTTADGAGITIKGATDKTLNWVQSTGSFTSSDPLIINTNSTTKQNLIIKAIASQTADLQEWQDSAGTVLAKVTAAGAAQFVSIDGGSA